MLLAFRVSNFRSVRDEQELSFVRSRRLARTSADQADAGEQHWNLDVSTVAALYGGNASGKSNVLEAVSFMARVVADSYSRWSPDGDIPVEPFRLDATHPHEPSRFEVELLLEGARHQYGFELNQHEVLREWLYVYPHGRRQTWFERDRDAADEWYFGRALGGRNRVITELTRPNALFLSAAVSSKHQQLSGIHRWLSRHIRLASSRKLQHLCGDGSPPVGLPFENESSGTQALVALARPLLQALRHGYLFVADDLGASLHPRVVAELVKLFQSPASNPNQAQLVFSTHDASLLGSLVGDAPALDRDQVWFVEKDDSGATSMYPLTDFSPRRLENLERGYLQGRYGAVPFLVEDELISALGDAESVD